MTDPVLSTRPLGFPWVTVDPFLFCVHHNDAYPEGNEKLGPRASLAGRDLGQDFSGKDGWSMYHGDVVPGFPQHPHRGFETVTLVFAGEVEHRDSAGGGGTIGPGDVQWMTAGAGIVHEEFHSPRFAASGGNFEVAQLWVNLPAARKRTPARYQAITADRIPERTLAEGRARVRIVAGSFPVGSDIVQGPAETHSPVNVWDVQVVEDGPLALSLPDGQTALLVVLSGSLTLSEGSVAARDSSIRFTREGVRLVVGATHGTHVLVLAGAPLHEPIAGSGPFVMNTPDELAQAYADHRRGRLGH